MTARIRDYLLLLLVRWYVRNCQFETVLACFWGEFRDWYNEDNLPSALATVVEVLEECDEASKAEADGIAWHR